MKQELDGYDTWVEVDDVPVSPLLSLAKQNRYGSVVGLDDEELADPDELERQVYLEMFGPVLALPVKRRRQWVRPDIDQDAGIEWGAFGTVDFDGLTARFDRRWNRADLIDRLEVEMKNVWIRIEIILARVIETESFIPFLDKGFLFADETAYQDYRMLLRLYTRTQGYQQEISKLRQGSGPW